MDKVTVTDNRIYRGVLYRDENSIPFSKQLPYRKNVDTTPVEEIKKYEVDKYLREFI
jgi:hypothetical protein